jgi:hypothetical protein
MFFYGALACYLKDSSGHGSKKERLVRRDRLTNRVLRFLCQCFTELDVLTEISVEISSPPRARTLP